MKTQDIKNIASAYKQVLEKKTLDPVNPDELKGTHAQRKDKDIDNDGDVDKSDEYLHNRRKAVKHAMKKEAKDYGPGHIGAVQKMLDKERDAKKAKDDMKKEAVSNMGKEPSDTQMGTVTVTTDAERAKRAQAYRDKQASMKKEEVEELDELSKKTLGSYVKKAAGDITTKAYKAGDVRDKDSGKNYMKALGRQIGIAKATNKLTKEGTEMKESRWPILNRIMERQNHGNMDNGSPRGEGLSPSAKAELARTEGDSGIDGAKAAADTIQNAAAQVKVAPKRPGDKTDGDKTMPKNDGK